MGGGVFQSSPPPFFASNPPDDLLHGCTRFCVSVTIQLVFSFFFFVSQAESAEEELGDLHAQHSELLEQLREREDILRRLEEETSFLKVEYSTSQSEVGGATGTYMYRCTTT